ncbi:MAG: ABC transporter permease [Mobiluncus sp.]|uniref:ABC transporter permease n=1 Tax=Mobiluncus sp. TaxID=47293 RepID=UPI00258F2680|nr:ABC transporter permease [Mobiluncus sp.]MCI6584992.1 ABC transporter permease [Mobiluncus sp.]
MWKLIIREITTRKSRFFAAILAVTLGVAFLTLTLGVRNLLLNAVTASTTSSLTGDLYAVGALAKNASTFDINARNPIDSNLAPVIEAVDGVSHAAPVYEGEAVLLDSRKQPVTLGLSPTTVRGSFPYPPGPTLAEGRLPTGAAEVMLETTTARRAGLKVGDKATLIWGGTAHEMQVVGTAGFEGPLGTATMAFVDAENAKTWFSAESRVKTIGIKVGAASDPKTVKDRVQDAIGPDATILLGETLRVEHARAVEKAVGFVNSLVQWFVALSLLAGGFLIANTFGILVTARYRSLGLLRAVGYSPRALRWLVLGQAVIIGTIGAALGVLLGIGATAAARLVLATQGWGFSTGLPLDVPTIALAFGIGLLITLFAAVFPAWRAGKIPPLSVLELAAPAAAERTRPRTIAGVLALLGALGTGWFGLTVSQQRIDWTVVAVLIASGILFLLGLMLLLVQLQRPVLAFFGLFTKGFNALPAHLALQNLRRYPRRTSFGAAALVIGVAIATAGGILADSARASLRTGTVSEVQTDLVVAALQPSTNLEQALGAIREVSGVRGASADIIQAPVLVRQGEDPTHQVVAAGISAGDAVDTLKLRVSQGEVQALSRGEVIMNSRAAGSGWKVGDSITVSGPVGIYSTRIGGVTESSLLNATVFLDPQYLRQTAASEQVTREFIFVRLDPGADGKPVSGSTLRAVQDRIQKALDPFFIFKALTPSELASTVSQTTTQVLWLMYGLLGFSVVIALLGVMNTLALAVLERRRTFALLRIIGLKPREGAAMVRWEAFFLALLGAVIGWAGGLALGALWRFVLRGQGLAVFSVPWAGQLALIGVAVILAVVAAGWPARQTLRSPALMSELAS